MEIEISGRRQSGKTEKMVWMTAGCILAGGSPLILAKNKIDAVQTIKRLMEVLLFVGLTPEKAALSAKFCVGWSDINRYGRTIILKEVDDDAR